MKKLIIIISIIIIIVLLIIAIDVAIRYIEMNTYMEINVPIFTLKKEIKLKEKSLFDNEILRKIYLSKKQTKKILKKVKENDNWINDEIDDKLMERFKYCTREGIFNEVPQIENPYWIITNRSNKDIDKHSINEIIKDYYAISIGILDLNNNILYYYEYDI